jgi:DNA recombination protein RmuC
MLPQNKKLHMDVKFPFSKFQDLMNSSETEKDRLTREFLRDFKDRIKEITDSRNYINTEDNTLDNALIFIPSDNVLQFIYDNDYSIIEYAHNKKVIVISPMNLLAILGVIREFIETVSISEKNQEFRLMLDSIQKQWAIYKNEHQKLLRQYQTLGNTMRNLSETRINAIDRQFLKMESLKISTSNEIPGISEENESVNIIDELKEEEEPVESDYQNLN